MIYHLPIVGWLIGAFFAIAGAIPFWYFWNWLGPIYFYWLPAVYLNVPFWHVVGLFIIVSILKARLYPNMIINQSSK